MSATFAKKSSTRVDDPVLQRINASLSSTDWKNRVSGVQQLQEFVISQPTVADGHFTKVVLLTLSDNGTLYYYSKIAQWNSVQSAAVNSLLLLYHVGYLPVCTSVV